MSTFVQVLDFIGTFAFAISGVQLASQKRFDWFGAYVVGFVTAIGGGTLRDMLLDVTPAWMTNPIYVICTGMALLSVICFGRFVFLRMKNMVFLFDTIGLALFTVVGMGKCLSMGYPYWTAIIMGCMTGAAGGMIRDVLSNEIPLIFQKDIYAMACVAGGVFYWGCALIEIPPFICQIGCGVMVFLIRVLAVKYRIRLPVLSADKYNDTSAGE